MHSLNNNIAQIKTKIYDTLHFYITELYNEAEGTEYDACQFNLSGARVISRSAKLTPKKIGQFVTCWKRAVNGETQPYTQNDDFNFYVINVTTENRLGQFVFPKSELILRGIVTSSTKPGKRGFRVYPKWDTPTSSQAIKTQAWQLNFFYEIDANTNLEKVKQLYS